MQRRNTYLFNLI